MASIHNFAFHRSGILAIYPLSKDTRQSLNLYRHWRVGHIARIYVCHRMDEFKLQNYHLNNPVFAHLIFSNQALQKNLTTQDILLVVHK